MKVNETFSEAYRSVAALPLSKYQQRIWLGLILGLCLLIRIWTIHVPSLDRTAWKEIDYLEISKNYWRHGFHFWAPEITWPAEPPRVTAMEMPLVPYLAALLYSVLGYNAFSARLIPLLAYLLLTVYVFRLARRELGPVVALVAALASALMPLYHPNGRMLFSEPLMIALSAASVFHFAEWVDFHRRRDWIVSVCAFSVAIALKIEPLFLTLIFFYLWYRRHQLDFRSYVSVVKFVLLASIPAVLWFSYALYLSRSSIDVFGVLPFLGGHNKMQTWSMLTRLSWYRTLAGNIFRNLLGGPIGAVLVLAGVTTALITRSAQLFLVYLAAVGFYFAIVAEGQIDAPYRQLNAVTVLSVFLAIGACTLTGMLFRNARLRWRTPATLAACFVLLFGIAVYNRRLVFEPDPASPATPEKWQFAREIKERTGREAKLITVGEYTIHVGGNDLSPVLYYYTGLQGWSLQKGQWNLGVVDNLIARGATHFVALDMQREPSAEPFLDAMKSRYKVLYDRDGRLLLDLRSTGESVASAVHPDGNGAVERQPGRLEGASLRHGGTVAHAE